MDSGVGARTVGDLVAYQWARAFKLDVYRLFNESATARGDLKYRDQVFDAAASVEANIAEGFGRYTPGQFAVFLRYALASLAECRTRLQDGVDRGHFRAADIEGALVYAARCEAATRALRASQQRLVEQRRKGPSPAG